jgi:Ca2+-binding RTX toxin-like protein
MDLSFLANMLLFLGALGASYAVDQATTLEETDPLYDENDYTRTDEGTGHSDALEADRDSLAWFLQGGDDRLAGSAGSDYANLGNGNDEADMGAGADIALGGNGADTISGGNGGDRLFGGEDDDSLSGNLGDDTVFGEAGNDILTGGSGADVLSGGEGDDILSGFDLDAGAAAGLPGVDGNDQLLGGEGNDLLLMGHGDVAAGGGGNDIFQLDTRFDEATAAYRISDYSGTDDRIEILYVPRYSGDTSLEIPPEVRIEASPDGESALIRLNGTLIAQVDGAAGLTADDLVLTPDTGLDPNYLPSDYDAEVTGTAGPDTFSGGSDGTAWFLQGGDDSLTGSSDGDYARLGEGNDFASMGDGVDVTYAEAGDDHVLGGAGTDTIYGGDGADTLEGGSGADRMAGELGADAMTGGAGADNIVGGAGDDTISGYTSGAGGEDSLIAIDGIDTLSGGDGNDQIHLGRGDVAVGGAGDDRFNLDLRWDEGAQVALITDFTKGTDQLELHYTPVFVGGVEVPPVVTITYAPDASYATLRLDGEAVAQLTGATTLTVSDVVLIAAA